MFQANFSSAFLTFTKKLLFVLLLFTVSGQFLKAQPLPDIATSSLSNMFTATNTSPFDYQRIKRAVIINATGADLSAKYVAQRASIASKILSNFNAMKSANAITNTTTTYAYLGSPTLGFTIIAGNDYCKKMPSTILQQDYAFSTNRIEPTISLNMQFKQRIISIRDKNQPNTAPTIMVSHGNPFTDYTTMFNTIADLVMRGYNVIFYETSASEGLFLSPQPVVPCGDASAVTFQRMAYTGYQHAYAATQYVKQNATTYNVDVNKLFLLGGSFSGFASLTLAYADSGNFTHNIFHNSAYGTDLGTKSALVKTGVPDLGEHTFKGVCVTAGGFPGTKNDGDPWNDSKIGTIFDTNVRTTPVAFLHGGKDTAIPVKESMLLSCTGDIDTLGDDLNYEGPLKIRQYMNALSSPIWNKTIVNCYGGHGFLTEFTGIGAGNYKEKQELNFGFIAGHFFNFILSNTSLTFYTDIESISTQTSPNNPTAACTAPLTFSTFTPNGLYTDIANCICDDIGTNPGDYKQQFATTTPLTLSPNPTRNNLNLAYNTTTTEDATITLYDLTGKAVLQTTETATEGTNNYNLQLTDLPTGMYIVQLQTATQRLTQKVQVIR